jgi:hypothetical protein
VVTSLQLADRVADALGMPGATVVQHLRNLQKEEGRISFKGYGRGAARMGLRDAASLLLAAAGSELVKDSLATLDAFGGLRPVRPDRTLASGVTFLDHLMGLLTAVAASGGTRGPAAVSNVAFRLVSAVGGDPKSPPPRLAVSVSGVGFRGVLAFAPAGSESPMRSEAEFATRLRDSGSGLMRVSIVTIESLEKVAGSL